MCFIVLGHLKAVMASTCPIQPFLGEAPQASEFKDLSVQVSGGSQSSIGSRQLAQVDAAVIETSESERRHYECGGA
jgi:hypothetical protein